MLISSTLLTIPLALVARAQSDGLQVRTAQGPVIGSLVSPTVRQFLGIPYATARRWEAPTPPPSRSSPFHAANFSDTCPQALNPASIGFLQLLGFDNSTIFVPESEECLTVNIWAPSISRKQHTAILLWVYGGAFQYGTSNFPVYDGGNIVRDNDDVLVVSFNYRLNIFGFPNAPQLVSNEGKSQNFGHLDIDAAVQWVYDNIAAFGGDSERITLFGQSAGGFAIDAYTFAHPQDNRVKGVIEQSGNVHVELSIFPEPTSQSWGIVANAVGCGNVTDDAQLTCMKQLPFRQLEDAVIGAEVNFFPLPDGVTFFSDTPTRAAAGNFLQVPLLVGSTQNEGDFVGVTAEITTGFSVPNMAEILDDLITLIDFTCPVGLTAFDRVTAKVPTWRYEYQAVFSDISLRPDLRSYHTSELPVFFGTFASPTGTEKALSQFVQNAWVAFARDPAHGLLNIGWPQYSPNTTTLAQIGGFFNQTGITFGEGRLLDFTCNSTETLGAVQAQLTALLGPAGIGFGFL